KITIKISCAVAVSLILMFTGCNKDLVEHPEATLNAVYLNSSAGALAGISGVYSDLRNLWGTEGFTAFTVAGTDDYLAGSSASSLTLYTYNNVDPNSGAGLWGIGYQTINTLDGVLKFLPGVSFSTTH